jgi:ketosteroid isomerase-like protein
VQYLAEIDPKINIFGNTAVVTYYFEMSFEIDGQPAKTSGRDLFVFLKEGDKWWAVANQFSPYPKK